MVLKILEVIFLGFLGEAIYQILKFGFEKNLKKIFRVFLAKSVFLSGFYFLLFSFREISSEILNRIFFSLGLMLLGQKLSPKF